MVSGSGDSGVCVGGHFVRPSLLLQKADPSSEAGAGDDRKDRDRTWSDVGVRHRGDGRGHLRGKPYIGKKQGDAGAAPEGKQKLQGEYRRNFPRYPHAPDIGKRIYADDPQ